MSDLIQVPFYVAGGTMPVGSAAYVTRRADAELLSSLLRGEFCYVLTSRQMGKSSLMARTALRLRQQRLLVAILDLPNIGHDIADKEQWYYSLLMDLAESLKMRPELRRLWETETGLTPLQKWIEALRFVLRARDQERLVIFIDEIDTVLALPFKAGEFFAAIRACYNRRSEDPEFNRLTFCLLGVASPSDLIDDTRLTPFNIGRRIELNDFTAEEAAALQPGLGSEEILREAVLERVFHWTGGHPYLTQRLCQAVVESDEVIAPPLVDRQCGELFLSPRAREQDDNLILVRNRLLNNEAVKGSSEELAALLDLYRQVCTRRPVPDNKAMRLVTMLRLSGIVRSESGCLRVRNRIYARVFDAAWISEHMPDAEKRRQRAAYLRGVIRTASLSGLIATLFLGLTLFAIHQKREALEAKREALLAKRLTERLSYAADIVAAQQDYEHGDYGCAARLLQESYPKQRREELPSFEARYLWRLMHQDVHTLVHDGKRMVFSVAFSPNGGILASSNSAGTIKLWDAASYREGGTLPGPADGIISLAFSPTQPQMLASGNLDGTVTLWDTEARREMPSPPYHTNQVYCVAFSQDGKIMASSSTKETILWDVTSTPRRLATLQYGVMGSGTLAFAPNKPLLAVATNKRKLVLYDISKPQEPVLVYEHNLQEKEPGSLTAAAFSPGGAILVVGRSSGAIDLWDVVLGRRIASLSEHTGLINGIAFSPDGRCLATASWDMTVRLWDVATRKSIHTYIGHRNKVTCVAFSPDGTRLASSGSDEVKIWDAKHWSENTTVLPTPGVDRNSLTYDREGNLRQFMYGTDPSIIVLWDFAHRRSAMSFHGKISNSCLPALSPDGKTLVAGISGGKIVLWDVSARKETAPIQVEARHDPNGRTENIDALAFSSDSNMVAVASGDSSLVTLWDIHSRQCLWTSPPHSNHVHSLAFSPYVNMLAVASWSGTVSLWNLTNKSKAVELLAHTGMANSVAFSPDGKTLATGGEDKTVRLWNVATQQEVCTLRDFKRTVNSVAFSPDGKSLAVLSEDKQIRIYQAAEPGRNTTR